MYSKSFISLHHETLLFNNTPKYKAHKKSINLKHSRTMKRMKLLLLMSLLSVSSLMAMPYSEARREALFLTDKMAYELNLSYDQYDYVYQVNLDYFLNVSSAYDCTGKYWDYRNTDLCYILHDWQYALYRATTYFFTPIRWVNSVWHYLVYDHYREGYHYFNKPNCYSSYYGGKWNRRKAHTPSPYKNHRAKPGAGMRDHYHKGNAFEDKHKPSYNRPGNRNQDRPSVNHKNDRNQNNRPSVGTPNRDNNNKNERPKNDRTTVKDPFKSSTTDRSRNERSTVKNPFDNSQRNNQKVNRQQRSNSSKPASRSQSNSRGNGGGRSFGR